MHSKIIFALLLLLSFTIFHDLFISVIEKNPCTKIVHSINNQASSCDTVEFNKIHAMLHFMAIMLVYDNTLLPMKYYVGMPHYLDNYSPPSKETSHKPPIV